MVWGEIKNEKYDGYGILYFPNGDLFEGGWKNGGPNGYGIFYSSLGFKIKWFFRGTKLETFIVLIYKIFLFLSGFYFMLLRNKRTLLFMIILILGALINW